MPASVNINDKRMGRLLTVSKSKSVTAHGISNNIDKSAERRVFRFIYFEGKTQFETAKKINADQSTVSRIISKYLKDT